MKICILASGSSGNCIFVGTSRERVLIDAGLSARETARRLEQIGVALSTISAVCLTHEHSDHIAGLAMLQRRYDLKIFANSGTIEAIRRNAKMRHLQWQTFSTGMPFQIGDLTLTPFPVSHDAYEPVGFIAAGGNTQVGIVTDIGAATHLVREHLRRCQALIVEANHDEGLLSGARRPWILKQRIAGRQGHMSNAGAAQIIAETASPELRQVFLCHISRDCNRPELALKEVKNSLARRGMANIQVSVTFANQISEIWTDEKK
jgi:phosphoribosyl 1,2-cyclic phosphodiesterase